MTLGVRPISIEIPTELYQRLEKVAQLSGINLASAMIEASWWLYTPPPIDHQAALDQLQHLSIAQLWAIVYQRFKPEDEQQFTTLNEVVTQRLLSDEEQQQLDYFIGLMDYQVLLRSQALLLLKHRGQPIENYTAAPLV